MRTPRADSCELGRLLVGLGHRDMAVLSGPPTVLTAVHRVTGFRRAVVGEAGLPEPQVLHGSFSIESGREMAMAAMAGTPRPTALFATNNFIAIGVLHALDELGIRVPEDVAVVGLDDLPEAMVTFPFLTVAAQPAFEVGHEGVAMLLDRLGRPRPPDTRGHPPHHAGDPAVERGPAGLTAPWGRRRRAPRRTAGGTCRVGAFRL